MTEAQIILARLKWLRGCNTKIIADSLRVPEHEVYNRIDLIKRLPV